MKLYLQASTQKKKANNLQEKEKGQLQWKQWTIYVKKYCAWWHHLPVSLQLFKKTLVVLNLQNYMEEI